MVAERLTPESFAPHPDAPAEATGPGPGTEDMVVRFNPIPLEV
jgi:hypothetical protein